MSKELCDPECRYFILSKGSSETGKIARCQAPSAGERTTYIAIVPYIVNPYETSFQLDWQVFLTTTPCLYPRDKKLRQDL